MSSGTFSLMPGPPSVGLDPANFAGALSVGPVAGFASIVGIAGDLAAQVKEAPTPIVQAAYVRAARDWCRRTEYLRRNLPIAALTANQPLYNFGSDPNLEIVDVCAASVQQQPPSTNFVNLRSTSQDTYDPNMAPDIPNWYSYLPDGMLVLYPTPNNAYNFKVELVVQPLVTATQLPLDLLVRFNTYFEWGAKWFLYQMDKEPWYNPQLAAEAKGEFHEGVGIGKSWVDKGKQRGSVRANPRPFIAR